MARIQIVPEHLDELSRQILQVASELRDLEGRLGRALGALDWEARQQANVEGQVNAVRRRAQNLAGEAERLARFLTERAAAFRQADEEGARSIGDAVRPYMIPPIPVPVPTPTPKQGEVPALPTFDEIIGVLDDLLKPIDWATSKDKATKVFFEDLKAIGRILNKLTRNRGYVKLMTELGVFLRNVAKGIGVLSAILDATTMHRYFSGQITNAEIVRIAVSVIVSGVAAKVSLPIVVGTSVVVLTNMLADWMVQNMSDPNGRWHGTVE